MVLLVNDLMGVEKAATAPLQWVDARSLNLEGQGWPSESAPFARLPDRAKESVPPRVWDLSRDSAGLVVHFFTNSTTLTARWSLRRAELAMRHMPATGVSGLDLYVRDQGSWRWMSVGQRISTQKVEQVLLKDRPAEQREYLLFLPLYNGVDSLSLGVDVSAEIDSAASHERPIVIYGTSIVQGACASRPGMPYTALLRRFLDRPVINLGFSGNGRSEPELAKLAAELDAAVFVLDSLPNLQPDQVQRVDTFIGLLRAVHPRTPIVLVGSVRYADADFNRERADRVRLSNQALHSIFERRRRDDQHLWLVRGEELLSTAGEDTVDGTHPTDLGFQHMVKAIEPAVRQALGGVPAP